MSYSIVVLTIAVALLSSMQPAGAHSELVMTSSNSTTPTAAAAAEPHNSTSESNIAELHNINLHMKQFTEAIKVLTARFDQLEAQTGARFEQLEARFDQLEAQTGARFGQLEAQTAALIIEVRQHRPTAALLESYISENSFFWLAVLTTVLLLMLLLPASARAGLITEVGKLPTAISDGIRAVWDVTTLDKARELAVYAILLWLLPNFPFVYQLLIKAAKV